ncbi:CDP-alcohol phosphatidyltransferase family protein [Candidatus Bathyarchaeota archaeon]|nr:CDP-alcohol phosphatidyltransferase family protein [Candidatus Bathyarchaeota archaeon]
MLTKIKKKIQSLLKAEAAIANRIGLTPNHLSFAGVLLGVLSGIFYWLAGINRLDPVKGQSYLFGAVVFLLSSGFFDALDGVLARLYKKTSIRGGFLDSLLDRYVDAAVYSGIMLGGLCDLPWGLLALIGSLLTSYARARSEAENVPMETVGIFERAERIITIAAASLLNLFGIDALRWGILFLALVTNFTVLQRAAFFFKRSSLKQK